jgi:ABC-type phosphate transport system permease subunit
MMSVTGPIMIAAAVALLWYMRPGSRLNRWATTPMLELLIPVVIVGMFAIGVVLTIFRV